MEYLYIICIGLLIFFSFSLLSKKNKPLSEKIFSVWIILLLVTVVSFFLYVKGMARQYPVFITFICDSHLLHGALLLLYLKAFTDSSFRLNSSHLVHLIPMIIMVAGKLFLNYVVGEMQCYKEGGCIEEDNIYVGMTFLYKYLVLGGYIAASWKVVGNYRQKAAAPREKMRLEWVRQISLGVTFLYFGILMITAGRFLFPDLFWERMLLGNILATLFIFIFLYIGNSYTYLFVSPSKKRFMNLSESFNPAQCRNHQQEDVLNQTFRKLERLMQESRPYLQPQLGLQEIARKVDVPPAQISQAIQRFAGANFNEYINRYRVEHLKALLEQPVYWNYKIMALAADSGFSSKSSLIRIFKKETGMTPGQFLQEQKKEQDAGSVDPLVAS